MGEEKDLPVGRQLVDYFTPFLLHLAESGLSKRTIQNHVDNMWLLGGEIIREVNQEPRLRKSSAEQLVRNVIHEDGGPLIHNGWEDEQRSFDSTLPQVSPFPLSTPALRPASYPQLPRTSQLFTSPTVDDIRRLMT